MTTDTTEKGLETLIVRHMTGTDGLAVPPNSVARPPTPYGGTGYTAGNPLDYDRAHALDVPQLFAFLRATQPEAFKKLAMVDSNDAKDINRLKFLARLSGEIGKRGAIDVLRKGVEHGPVHFDLFYGTPSLGNAKAEALHAQNRFAITRQLAYSMDETRRALGLCLFINGLPIATFELKNSLTKQTVEDAPLAPWQERARFPVGFLRGLHRRTQSGRQARPGTTRWARARRAMSIGWS